MSSPTPIFSLSQVSVNYGNRHAVSSVSLDLKAGESLGLLGLNGAGKTSTIRALLGMTPYRGNVELFGQAKRKTANFGRLGFAPEEGVPPEYLSGQEYLEFVARFRVTDFRQRREQVSELLEWFELDPRKRIYEYSKGMKRRIVLAQAFLGRPELLVLDEPLNGLDPLLIIKLRDRLEQFHQSGGSLLYSSHILAEVEKTCTSVAILRDGTLVYRATTNELLQEFGSVEKAFATKVGAN